MSNALAPPARALVALVATLMSAVRWLPQTPSSAASSRAPRSGSQSHRSSRPAAMICALVVGAGLSATVSAHAREVVRISGTGSGTGGMQRAAEAFMKTAPDVQVEVLPAMGSSGGIDALIDGRLDLSLSNRQPNEMELARSALQSVEYARTPFVVVVHRSLGITALSNDQLAALFAEGAAQFPNGQRARPVLRLSDATDTTLLKAFAPQVATAVTNAMARRGMLNASTDSEAADLVEKTPGAFAASTLALLQSEARPLVALTIEGKPPSLAALRDGSYPYMKSLYLISGPATTPAAQRFARYIQSPEGRQLLEGFGHAMR